MTSRLSAIAFDANDPHCVASFWAGVLGWEMTEEPDDGVALLPSDDTGFRIEFLPSAGAEARAEPDALRPDEHLLEDQQETVAQGARARRPAHRHRPAPGGGPRRARRPRGQRVLRDRAGQQLPRRLRVPRSDRRATARRRSGTSGARRWAGRWSGTRTRRPRSARRTAVRRSRGAARRCTPKPGKNRLHLDLAPPADGDQQAEVERLVSLGATRVDIGQGDVGWVVHGRPRRQRVLRTDAEIAVRRTRSRR